MVDPSYGGIGGRSGWVGADRRAGGAGERGHDHGWGGRAVLGRGRQPGANSAPTANIEWGDGTPTSTGTPSRTIRHVSGTHTYTTHGTFDGTVTLTRWQLRSRHRRLLHGQRRARATDVHPVPGGRPGHRLSVPDHDRQRHRSRHPGPQPGTYEGADDALIGVQNNSSSPISAAAARGPQLGPVRLRAGRHLQPGRPRRFSPGASRRRARRPARYAGIRAANCAFPPPAGEPAGYVEPGASVQRVPQNGYEGPTSWFSNVRAGQQSPASSTSRRRFLRADRPTSASRSRRSARRSASAAPRLLPAGCRHRRSRAPASRSRRS